jgi:hypothetical protein
MEGHHRLCTRKELEQHRVELIDSMTGETITITQKDCTEWHQTLGIHESPALLSKHEFNRLSDRVDSLVTVMLPAGISDREMWIFFTSIYTKSIGYSGAVTNLKESEWSTLQLPMKTLFLNRLHYACSLANAVTFATRADGGAGFLHGYASQCVSHIKALLTHLRTPGQACMLLQITLRWWQHFSGLSYSILAVPSLNLSYLPGPWIHTIHQYLKVTRCTITIPTLSLPQENRVGDISIMEYALSKEYTPGLVAAINQCRIYLQVTWISEVSTVDGTRILSSFSARHHQWNPPPHSFGCTNQSPALGRGRRSSCFYTPSLIGH